MWDQRYDTPEYVYGREPNAFLAANLPSLPGGRALCLAEGEGRNAVFLARSGFDTTAVDLSAVGLRKARALAEESGVRIETVRADLAEYPIPVASIDLIVSIFCHLPAVVRTDLHRRVVDGLRAGGVYLLEAYTPDQIGRGTGGPSRPELMVTLEDLRRELHGLEIEHGRELVRPFDEGSLHQGDGAVVQVIARKV
jgi:SAM-dependent methyltransferase